MARKLLRLLLLLGVILYGSGVFAGCPEDEYIFCQATCKQLGCTISQANPCWYACLANPDPNGCSPLSPPYESPCQCTRFGCSM